MLPLITECVRGKSSSSALLEFTIEMLPNGNTLVNATSGYEICLRQEWLQRLVENHCQHVAGMGTLGNATSNHEMCQRQE